MGEAAASIAKDPNLGGSNLYSVAEGLLLRWLTHHHRPSPSPTSPSPPPPPLRFNAFDARLSDGHAFASLLLSHCPFLRGRAKRLPNGGEVIVGSSLDALHPPPCGPKESIENLSLVLQARPDPKP